MAKKSINFGIYYAAIHKEKGILRKSTIRETKKDAFEALKNEETWSNCFDQTFIPTKKELLKEWRIIALELKEKIL